LDGLAAVAGPATHMLEQSAPRLCSPDSCIGRRAGKPGLGGADLISGAPTASRFGVAVAGRTGVVFVCAAGPCENKGSKEKLKELFQF